MTYAHLIGSLFLDTHILAIILYLYKVDKITMRRFTLLTFMVLFTCLMACDGENNDPDPIQDQPLGEFIDENTYRVFPTNQDNFGVAEFRLWVPESTEKVRAVLVLLGSYNYNGLGLAKTFQWQAFGDLENIAIVGVNFKTISDVAGYYPEAHLGSGQALLNALAKLAERNGNDYLKDLPLLLRGYSAGGVFSYSFSDFKHERVLAFANIRGGSLNFTRDINSGIPGLMIYGENDAPQRNSRIISTVEEKRNEGGNWSLLKEPGVDHFGELTKPDSFIRMFFQKVLASRLTDGSNELNDLAESDGWLGDPSTLEIYPYDEFIGDKTKASWLIDEEYAKSWKAFQQD